MLAVLLVAGFPFAALVQHLPPEINLILLRVYLFGIAGAYFALFWRKGQTLAMKTWRIRMVNQTGEAPSVAQVWLRFALASLNLALLGVGWWAALWRKDGQFLQDHYADTRLERY